MNNQTEIVVVLVLLVAIAASKMIASTATQKLDDEMKLKIFEGFSRRNNYFLIVILAVIFAYFVSMNFLPNYTSYFTVGYIVVLAAYFFVKVFLNFRKLKEIGAPTEYVRSIAYSWTAFIIGFGVIAVIVIAWITESSNRPF